MVTRIFLCIWVCVLAALVLPSRTYALETTGFVAGDCLADVTIPAERTVECGTVTLPLYHDQRKSGVVSLPVMIVRSTSPNDNLPLYLLQGGPGGDTIDTFSYVIDKKDSVLPRDRDLVFFEQRGTTHTTPSLDCPEIHANDIANLDKDLSDSESARLYQTAWQACLDRLHTEGTDIAAFNSFANADDVAAIAQIFGHTSIDLYGVSYGSLLAQHVVERHPGLVRAVILDGVVPKDREPNYEAELSKNDAFGHMFADCAADAVCSADYPDLQNTYVTLVAKFNKNPIMLDLVDPDTDQTYPTLVNGDGLTGLLFQLHYDSELVTFIPMLITQIAAEQYDIFKVFASFTVFHDSISEGMYNATTCSEETVPQKTEIILPQNPITPIDANQVDNDVQWFAQTCGAAAVPALDASANRAFTTNIPTLLLSGRYDPITPARMGDTVVKGLPNATHVVFPNTAHGAFIDNACAAQIVVEFLATPQDRPDTACVAVQKVTFATRDGLSPSTFPLRLARLDESTYLPLGVMGLVLTIMLLTAVIRPLAWLVRTLLHRPQPSGATRVLFGAQWLLVVATSIWLGYVVYVCFDLVNPSGNYGYHTFFGVPTTYHLATTAYIYAATIIAGIAMTVFAVRTRNASQWTTVVTSFLLLISVVLLGTVRYIGLFGG